jgi:hypothetical protein
VRTVRWKRHRELQRKSPASAEDGGEQEINIGRNCKGVKARALLAALSSLVEQIKALSAQIGERLDLHA